MLSVSTPINNDTHRSHQLTVVSKDSESPIFFVSINENTKMVGYFFMVQYHKNIIKPPVFLGFYPWYSPPKPPAVTGQRAPSVCLSFRPPGHAAVAGQLGRLRLRRGSGSSAAYSSRAQWPRETNMKKRKLGMYIYTI